MCCIWYKVTSTFIYGYERITNFQTLWGRFLLEKLIVLQLPKKFPAFYGTQSSLLFSKHPPRFPIPNPINTVHAFPILFLSAAFLNYPIHA